MGHLVEIFPTFTNTSYSWKKKAKEDAADFIKEEARIVIEEAKEDVSSVIEEAKEVAEVVEEGISGLESIIKIIKKHHLKMESAAA
jgi:hypothetical protein